MGGFGTNLKIYSVCVFSLILYSGHHHVNSEMLFTPKCKKACRLVIFFYCCLSSFRSHLSVICLCLHVLQCQFYYCLHVWCWYVMYEVGNMFFMPHMENVYVGGRT